jgi:RNA polymerase sigma-70 factor, ECF subfamily
MEAVEPDARETGARSPVDDELVAACRRGDREALGTVFRRESPALERMLLRVTGHPALAEDLLQETFAAALEAFPRFRGDASVATWLARIAVRQVQQHWRRADTRRRSSLELVVDETDGGAPSPDRVVDSSRRLERIHEHLRALGANKRLAFVLRVLEGRSVDEVAALMGASHAATRSRIYFARRGLLARMRKDPALRDLVEELA